MDHKTHWEDKLAGAQKSVECAKKKLSGHLDPLERIMTEEDQTLSELDVVLSESVLEWYEHRDNPKNLDKRISLLDERIRKLTRISEDYKGVAEKYRLRKDQ